MTLKEELAKFEGKKRRFLLLRIADIDTSLARTLCGITTTQYNNWCNNREFVALQRRRVELSDLYKQEAVQLLRRDNQKAAVLLEEKIIQRINEELDSKTYDFIRTNLAREVYSKLIADLDAPLRVAALTWEQRIGQIINNTPPPQIVEGEVVLGQLEVGSGSNSEADSSEAEQHTKSDSIEGRE